VIGQFLIDPANVDATRKGDPVLRGGPLATRPQLPGTDWYWARAIRVRMSTGLRVN